MTNHQSAGFVSARGCITGHSSGCIRTVQWGTFRAQPVIVGLALLLTISSCSTQKTSLQPTTTATAATPRNTELLQDQTDDLVTELSATQELTAEEQALLLQAMGIYNWSSDELEEDLVRQRDRLRSVNDSVTTCMAAAGFTYIHLAPEEELQLWSGFESQFGTQQWSERYGFGVTTLLFSQESLPDDVIGSQVQLETIEASDTSPEALYLESLGVDGRNQYDDALMVGPDSCLAIAQEANPEFENTDNIQFQDFSIEDLKQRSFATEEFTRYRQEAAECLERAGYDVGSELDAQNALIDSVIESGFESPEYIDLGSDPPEVSPEGLDLLRTLQLAELELAAKVWECGSADRQLNAIAQDIAIGLYAELVSE